MKQSTGNYLVWAWSRGEGKAVRLLGVGVKFEEEESQLDPPLSQLLDYLIVG